VQASTGKYRPDVGLIRPPSSPEDGEVASYHPEWERPLELAREDEIRQRLISINTSEISPMRARSEEALQKEAAFESLDYNPVDSHIQILAQRAVDHRVKRQKRREITVLRWVLTVLVGIGTGLVASFINLGVRELNKLKYALTTSQIEAGIDKPTDPVGYFVLPFLVFVGTNVGYVLVATLLVSVVEPVARGSGIPEVKCYLNGVAIPRVVRLRTLACKAVGVLFSVGGGLPVGKEGPMIHSGAVVGAGVSQGKNSTLGWDTSWTKFNAFRNDHEKRDFVACGTAAGVAAAFGAPIGGALFALEEGTTHWSDFLTWRTFVCAMVSGFTLDLTMSLFTGDQKSGLLDQHGSITFGTFHSQDAPYTVQEVPFFILLGALGGLVGAAFNALNERLTVWRKAHVVKHAGRNIFEALCMAAVVASLAFAVPFVSLQHGASCVPKANFEEPGKVGGVELANFTTFYCAASNTTGEATVNDFALLFFQPSEDTIKMLFHSEQDLTSASLLTFTGLYFLLACATYGIAVPSGLFVPSLLLGAAFGRLYGQLLPIGLRALAPGFTALSEPGVYSLIGSAAMLGGMARMTISITVIMIEATDDYSYGLPLMLTLMTARWVGNLFNHGLYDIHIHLNKVPLLEGTDLVGPWEQTRAQDVLTASDIMSPCGPEQQLEEVERVADVVALLHRSSHNAYPVNEPGAGPFAGLILRRQLCQLLKEGVYTKAGILPAPVKWDDTVNTYPTFPSLAEAEHAMRQDTGAPSAELDVGPFMSPTPYTIQNTSTLSRVLHLFQRLGLRHLPVVDNRNNVVGMITRKDIVHSALDEALLRLHRAATENSSTDQRLLSLDAESRLADSQERYGSAGRRGSVGSMHDGLL
jgi:chloride channel 7